MKICIECGTLKDLQDYHKHLTGRDGHRNSCKVCRCAGQRQRRIDNPSRARELDKQREVRDKTKRLAKSKLYREQNPEKVKARKILDRVNNRGQHRAQRERRRAAKLKAIPVWSNRNKVSLIFKKARRLEVWLEIDLHVDHIVPLISNFVCGLHCEDNLQILSAKENLQKGNMFWPDMWV